MNLKPLTPRKSLNKAFLKLKPNRDNIEDFKNNLTQLLDKINDTESEEHHKNTGDTLQGDARTFKTNYLNPFPLPKEVEESSEREISEKVEQVLLIKKQTITTDTTAIESQIDQLVYQLYDLTKEEIAIVENA